MWSGWFLQNSLLFCIFWVENYSILEYQWRKTNKCVCEAISTRPRGICSNRLETTVYNKYWEKELVLSLSVISRCGEYFWEWHHCLSTLRSTTKSFYEKCCRYRPLLFTGGFLVWYFTLLVISSSFGLIGGFSVRIENQGIPREKGIGGSAALCSSIAASILGCKYSCETISEEVLYFSFCLS